MYPPEDQLLARCRAGDTEALGCVYARYSALIFRCAYSLLDHYEDARDVSQETFVKAFQALPGFQGQCALRTWLLRICANLCRDRRRRRRSRPEVSIHAEWLECLSHPALSLQDPHADLERQEQAQAVWTALSNLPEAHREIIYLRDVEELAVEEVMQILGCSRTNVNVKLFRARKRLRESVITQMEAGEHAHG